MNLNDDEQKFFPTYNAFAETVRSILEKALLAAASLPRLQSVQCRAEGYQRARRNKAAAALQQKTLGGLHQGNVGRSCPYVGTEGDSAEGEVIGTIDGKVESRSVMDMKVEDRRATPRFRVQFPTMVSGATQPEGTGIILDLSGGGCQLESPLLILPGLSLELHIYVPGLDVQWVSEQTAGLAFVQIRETEQKRRGIDDWGIVGEAYPLQPWEWRIMRPTVSIRQI